MADLGVIITREGDAARGSELLEEAAGIARQLGDLTGQGHFLGDLGLAALDAGRPGAGSFSSKSCRTPTRPTTGSLGRSRWSIWDSRTRAWATPSRPSPPSSRRWRWRGRPATATTRPSCSGTSASCTRTWASGQAGADAGAAVDLLGELRNPEAAWYAEILQRYRAGDAHARPGPAGESAPGLPLGTAFGGSVHAGAAAGPPDPEPPSEKEASGPGLLRMAVSATKAMAKFLGSGLKTVTQDTHQERLRVCASCEHHTGLDAESAAVSRTRRRGWPMKTARGRNGRS